MYKKELVEKILKKGYSYKEIPTIKNISVKTVANSILKCYNY